ncbi:MAG: LPS assembly lipoprotein LptE [Pseudomonadota bacterium]
MNGARWVNLQGGLGSTLTRSVILLLVISQWGCGFQLRGAADLAPELSRTQIQGVSPYSDFAAKLRQQLRANGVQVVDSKEQAMAILRITKNKSGRRVLSVGDNGKVREYQLFSVLSFEVRGMNKERLLKNQTIRLTRDFVFNENDVLGKSQEAELLRQDMEGDLIRLMLYRLQSVGKS